MTEPTRPTHTVAIIQARMDSRRLPGKVLRPILGRPMLGHIIERISFAPGIDQVVVATSEEAADRPIRDFCEQVQCACFSGSELDVLDRFFQAASHFDADPIVRITGDCPFVDPMILGDLLRLYNSGAYDHVGLAVGAGAIDLRDGRFPDGLDAECFSWLALECAWKEAIGATDREHVTSYLWSNPARFRLGSLKSKQDYSKFRWTVDHLVDFQLISSVYEALYEQDQPFLMDDILEYLSQHEELSSLNGSLIGKEGYAEIWESRRRSERQRK